MRLLEVPVALCLVAMWLYWVDPRMIAMVSAQPYFKGLAGM